MKFRKISYEQYCKDLDSDTPEVRKQWEDIKIPHRATKYSAGYDFFSPIDFTLKPGEEIKLPTGICIDLQWDKFLAIYPRSGLGFKYRAQLNNCVAIVDADYSSSDNEGHIFLAIINDSRKGKTLEIKSGDAIAQGIIMWYFKTEDDDCITPRNGGLGSTGK